MGVRARSCQHLVSSDVEKFVHNTHHSPVQFLGPGGSQLMIDVRISAHYDVLTVDSTQLLVQTGGVLPYSPAAPSRSLWPTGTRYGGCEGHTHCHAERRAQQRMGLLRAAAAQPAENSGSMNMH